MGIVSYLKGFDAFAHPVTVNYRGEDSYSSLFGAFVTIAVNIFVGSIALVGLLDLIEYKDPQITQYNVVDSRDDGTEINLGEAYATPLFAFTDESGQFTELDPRMGKLFLGTIENKGYDSVAKSLSVDEYTEENFPSEYARGVKLSFPGSVYSSKEFGQQALMNHFGTNENTQLLTAVLACQQSDMQPGESCGTEQELETYFAKVSLHAYEVKNFIDYENVKIEGDLVKGVVQEYFTHNINIKKPVNMKTTMIETQVELMDKLWQIFQNPRELSMLNFGRDLVRDEVSVEFLSGFSSQVGVKGTPYFLYMVSIDTEVKKAKRVVTDTVGLFGDIGGFLSFFMSLASILVGPIAGKLFDANKAESLFKANFHPLRTNRPRDFDRLESVQQQRLSWFKNTVSIKMPTAGLIKRLQGCLSKCLFNKRERMVNKLIEKSSDKTAKVLDIRTFVKNHYAFDTLLRLLLTPSARIMLHMQRRSRVIETAKAPEEPSSSSSETNLKKEQTLVKQLRAFSDHAMHQDTTFERRLARGIFQRDRLEQPASLPFTGRSSINESSGSTMALQHPSLPHPSSLMNYSSDQTMVSRHPYPLPPRGSHLTQVKLRKRPTH